MKPNQTVETGCPTALQLDTWVMRAFATHVIPDIALAMHLLACPRCRQRAAIIWALLPEPSCATMHPVPQPDLSFLSR